jgi:hypothetical protein
VAAIPPGTVEGYSSSPTGAVDGGAAASGVDSVGAAGGVDVGAGVTVLEGA